MQAAERRVGTVSDRLNAIVDAIQLTETQYTTAKERYDRVGKWLTETGAIDGIKEPFVFPQGSTRTKTVIRPYREDDVVIPFDIDAVCRCAVSPDEVSSKSLYEKIFARLRENAAYKDRLTREPKCLRLNYEVDDFYLDIVPACKDPTDAEGLRLMIPDVAKWQEASRPTSTWLRTDPIRYAAWFGGKCAILAVLAAARKSASVAPVPDAEPTTLKAPLRRVVQLFKRYRDKDFLNDESVPSSILLTTLAANHYHGEADITEALAAVLDGISGQIEQAAPKRIQVMNPVEPLEDLASRMSDAAYVKFCRMVEDMRSALERLRNPRRPTDSGDALIKFGGKRVASLVSGQANDELQRAGVAGSMGVRSNSPHLRVLGPASTAQGVYPIRGHNLHLNG